MSRDERGQKRSSKHERQISVRAVRRQEPDVRKLAKAVIALAMAQAEADARAQRSQGPELGRGSRTHD